MTNARDIIADEHSDRLTRDGDSYSMLAALREAAGAADGDTITIGPDGTVGRLEPHGIVNHAYLIVAPDA